MKQLLKNLKLLSVFIVIISIILLGILFYFALPIAIQGHHNCSDTTGTCTVVAHFPEEAFLGFGLLGTLIIAGTWIFFTSRREILTISAANAKMNNAVKNLDGDEKKIYDFVLKSEGVAFQSDIIKNLGYSKVKASRLLDKMEAKRLVERRRRGMANLVMLKR